MSWTKINMTWEVYWAIGKSLNVKVHDRWNLSQLERYFLNYVAAWCKLATAVNCFAFLHATAVYLVITVMFASSQPPPSVYQILFAFINCNNDKTMLSLPRFIYLFIVLHHFHYSVVPQISSVINTPLHKSDWIAVSHTVFVQVRCCWFLYAPTTGLWHYFWRLHQMPHAAPCFDGATHSRSYTPRENIHQCALSHNSR